MNVSDRLVGEIDAIDSDGIGLVFGPAQWVDFSAADLTRQSL